MPMRLRRNGILSSLMLQRPQKAMSEDFDDAGQERHLCLTRVMSTRNLATPAHACKFKSSSVA
eukprot:8998611-Karenia_brevis.AAC.1